MKLTEQAPVSARPSRSVPADTGKFRNVCPQSIENMLRKVQAEAWDRGI